KKKNYSPWGEAGFGQIGPPPARPAINRDTCEMLHEHYETCGDISLFIGGEWRNAVADELIPVIDPVTERTIGSVSLARVADLDAALEAASRGFTTWLQAPPLERAKVL